MRRGDHGRLQNFRVAVEAVLNFNGRNVFAAGNDDVLGAVFELQVVVGVHHAEVAGVKPPARKGARGGFRVFQVALHHDVAAEHRLADFRAVARGRPHAVVRAQHIQAFQRVVAHSLPRVFFGLLRVGQRAPLGLPRANHRRPVGLGQAVYMRDAKPARAHFGEHRGRRRRGRGHHVYFMRKRAPLFFAGVDQHVHNHRRAAKMRYAARGDRLKNVRRVNPPQTDIDAGDRGQRPRKAPAVAVKHRQRPQIDRVMRQLPADNVAERVEVGAAVVVDHAFRVAGGAGGVVQRNRVPFIGRRLPRITGVSAGEKFLISGFADAFAAAGNAAVNVYDHRLDAAFGKRGARDFGAFAVHQQRLGFAVF